MNILPKKSWHVRNKKNIEKVRQDEENAALEQKEKERRVALAESEARSEILRQMARKRKHSLDDEENLSNIPGKTDKHLNLFQELESGEKVARKNKEHEEEIRKEKEKQEKAIGLLTYLGQGSSELEDKKPWYSEVPSRKQIPQDELDFKKKKSEDPMLIMNKYLEATEKYEADKSGKTVEKRHSQSKPARKPKAGPKTIEQLRRERLEREKAEKIRQQQVLNKFNNVSSKDEEPILDERKMRYNSQFNPDIARTRH